MQRQAKVGPSGDSFEREADRVADHVTTGSTMSPPIVSRLVQRESTERRDEPSPVQREAAPEEKRDASAVQRMEEPHKDETAPVQRAVDEPKRDEPTPESPAVQRHTCCSPEKMDKRPSGVASVQCAPTGSGGGALDAAASHAIGAKGFGQPLRAPVRSTLESRMGVDLSGVRVHHDDAAHASAAALNARAFTHQSDIWLGRGESPDDLHLMAHETTHVIQQGAAVRRAESAAPERKEEPVVQRAEAEVAPEKKPEQTVQRSDAPTAERKDEPSVQRTPAAAGPDAEHREAPVQRSVWSDLTGVAGAVWDQTGGRVVDAAGRAVQMGADFFWRLIRRVAPGIVPIIEQIRARGIIGYLTDMVSHAFDRIFAPLRQGGGFIGNLVRTFGTLSRVVHEVLGALAHGNCEPLFAALSSLGTAVQEMAGNVWDRITEFFRPIGDFFGNLWRKFGAPAVDFLGDVASDIWEDIKGVAKKLWDWTQPVRDALSAAWKWIKDQLGVGDEPEGQNGLLQWVQRKLGDAWNAIKARLQPIIGPIQAFVGKITALLPLDAILHLRETVHEWLHHASQMITKLRKPQGVTEDQESLRARILPAVKAAIVSLRGKIISAGTWVGTQITGIATSVTGFFGSLRSNPILGRLSGAINWIQEKVTSLGEWVQSGVVGLFHIVGNGVARLADWIEPILGVLRKLVSVVMNVVSELPGLVLGPVWRMIPACIKEPIKKFIIDHIVSHIPIISTFARIPEVWGRIQRLVMDFLARVFVNGDLGGAVMEVIRFVLEAAGVNVDLMLEVLANAADTLDTIIMHPVDFLGNLFSALSKGMQQFVGNIGTHLINGLLGWLLGPLEDLGVTPPRELTLGAIFDLVLQILGVSAAKIQQKLAAAVGPTATRVLEEAWRWISALIRGGIAGIWEEIKTRLSDLWEMVIGGISEWITVELVEAGIARLILMANPVGAVLEAIRTIYKVVTFITEKINQILQLVNAVVGSISKIATGMIDDAANWIENAMARSVSAILAFFADWLGIGNPAPKIREIVVKIQTKVDGAIDWLIEKAKALGQRLMGALGVGPGPDNRTPEQKAQDLHTAVGKVKTASREPNATPDGVRSKLPGIQTEHRLRSLELIRKSNGKYEVVGEVNPREEEEIDLEGNAPTGNTQAEAIPIKWFKPGNAYEPITLEVDGADVGCSPRGETRLPVPPRFDLPGNKVAIGVRDRYFPHVEKTVKRIPSPERQKEGQFKRLLAHYGFGWRNIAPDHVQDLAFSGPDEFYNLWPLSSSANTAANAVYTQRVEYKKGRETLEANLNHADLMEKWFRITSIRSAD